MLPRGTDPAPVVWRLAEVLDEFGVPPKTPRSLFLSRRNRWIRSRRFPASLVPSLLFVLLATVILGGGPAGLPLPAKAPSTSTAGSSPGDEAPTSAAPKAPNVCNAPFYVAVSSLLIPLPNPSTPLAAGGSLAVALEFEVNASRVNTTAVKVTFPSVFVTFPLAVGSTQVYFAPTSSTVPASGWSHSPGMSRTISFNTSLTFRQGVSASLSTQKVAVMASANYSQLSLKFHWSWTLRQPNGSSGTSGWSVPNGTDHLPSQLRSIFYPAPFVSFLSSSGAAATIGTNYTATLGGNVAARYFLLEMEHTGSGKVVQAQGQTAPTGATTFSVFIPVLGYTRSLAPGTYLVHVHDACGAMLYNKLIHASFAASVSLSFVVSPTTCGVKFNGTNRFNGTVLTLAPSITPYSVSVGCVGHTFQSWSGTGGLHVNNGTSLLISAGGTFTVRYV
jgi:hypothetical protein